MEKKSPISTTEAMHFENLPDVLTAKHIAIYLSLSLRRVYELINEGTIKGRKLGKKSIRVYKADFEIYLKNP